MRRQKVKGEPGLVRDIASRALLFTNRQETEAYKKKKAEKEQQTNEINTLKEEVKELRKLIHQLIERQEKP